MHYGMIRERALISKLRFYAVAERIMMKKFSIAHILRIMPSMTIVLVSKIWEKNTIIPQKWIMGWTEKGIDMTTIPSSDFFLV
jgi:hypothetical protein